MPTMVSVAKAKPSTPWLTSCQSCIRMAWAASRVADSSRATSDVTAAKVSTSTSVRTKRWVCTAKNRCQRSEEHTSELQSRENLVCRLLLEKKNLEDADNRNDRITGRNHNSKEA